jgi:hypothetical protein
MLKSILKKRLINARTLLISTLLLLQLTPTAYANTNGGSNPGNWTTVGASGGNTPKYTNWTSNLAIYLTANPNFIMDNAELQGKSPTLVSGDKNIAEPASWEATYKNWLTAENGVSVNKLYAQVFRRTFVSWGDDAVIGSLILTGKTFTVNGVERRVKDVTLGIDAGSLSIAPQHSAATDQLVKNYVSRATPPTASGEQGKGVYKTEILDYMKAWFKGEEVTSHDPEWFINKLVTAGASSEEKQFEAIHTWAYISGGIEAVMIDTGNKLGVAERWQQCFVEPGKEPDWRTTYITKNLFSILPKDKRSDKMKS